MQTELKERPVIDIDQELPQKRKRTAVKVPVLLSVIAIFVITFFLFAYFQFLHKNVDAAQLDLPKLAQEGQYEILFNAYDSKKTSTDLKLKIEGLLSDCLDKQITAFFDTQSSDQIKSLADVCKNIDTVYQKNKLFIDSRDKYDAYKSAYAQAKTSLEQSKYIEALTSVYQIPNDFLSIFKQKNAYVTNLKSDIYTNTILYARGLFTQGKYQECNQIGQQILKIIPDDPNAKNIIFSTTDLVEYTGPVQHIFFHPLIAFPERAFGTAPNQIGEDNYMATVYEFNQTLKQLYEKNYVLIDINSLCTTTLDQNGKVVSITAKKLMLPKGKKPAILSVDDVNYYAYMKRDGQVYKLILDDNGDVATYSITPENKELISHDNEIIPILDNYAKTHTDFLINGAKGCLALTGYEGVLGYRTDSPYLSDYQAQLSQAKAVAKRLKETGWVFASHSQGHRQTAMISFDLLKNDTDRWLKEVGSIIGPTNVYIYPFGQQVPPNDQKFKYLQQKGFSLFFGVGPVSTITYGPDYLIQLRRNIDGIALRDKRLYDLFDVPSLTDPLRQWYKQWVSSYWNKN